MSTLSAGRQTTANDFWRSSPLQTPLPENRRTNVSHTLEASENLNYSLFTSQVFKRHHQHMNDINNKNSRESISFPIAFKEWPTVYWTWLLPALDVANARCTSVYF